MKRKSKYEGRMLGWRGVRGEVVDGDFDFYEYWKECELNVGKRMKEEEVWKELAKDITNQPH